MTDQHHKIADLNQLYSDGESADQDLFAEQRSNIQLIAGNHYSRSGDKFWNRVSGAKSIPNDQKIRLTKNHIRKIFKIYVNSITSYAPGVQAGPKDKNSQQHQKAAELCNAVWADGKERHNFKALFNSLAEDFVGIGEMATKTFFDPMAGRYLGQEASLDENGQVMMDEQGQPVPSGVPKFAGDVIIERIFAFNIIRPSGCKNIHQAPWLCHRKMVDIKDLKSLIDASPNFSREEKDKLKKKIVDGPDQTYVVMDSGNGKYKNTKDQVMIKEWFFRPCAQYPMGYFYICADEDILFEGELPFGIFPIELDGFDEVPTTPRCRSIIKQLRPYQVEINRAASKMAEHQITLGDDKVLIQNGSKLTPGMGFPGVRSFQYSGMTPTVLQGRSGEQYLPYMNGQIAEMYATAMVDEQVEEKPGQFDVYTMLFRSIKDKKKFSLYTDKFENFLRKVFKTYIILCQKYYNEQHLIAAVGKSEYINIAEFKDVKDLCYSITLEEQSDDAETKLGRQLHIDHLIQYASGQLDKADIGMLVKLMPYANDEMMTGDLTLDYDTAVNYILALDRGEMPEPNQYDNHAYLIKKLTSRTRQPDFVFMNEQVKQNYQQMIMIHQQLQTDAELKIKQAQSEFIPSGGFLVACEMYDPNAVIDPKNPNKLPKRVRVPSEALQWLLQQLAVQGTDQKTLEGLSQGALSEMSEMLTNKMRGGSPAQPQQNGQTNPGGFPHGSI